MDLNKLIINYPEVRVKIEEEDKMDFLVMLIVRGFIDPSFLLAPMNDVIIYPDKSLRFTKLSECEESPYGDIPVFSSSVILSKKSEWEV